MRVDKFLSSVNILKRRSIAQDMCENGVVSINGIVAKSSKEVRIGDIITLKYLTYSKTYEVLALPLSKTIPKSQSSQYYKEI
ncbi:RNA-binding S4 domain-containing protein [Helicobacter marmotae]|uniref:RNA-binding S4 domain-containing protein n=1 Tax=Helicobacter marmotae TaxID=152490 RepID=A0A3D8I214_9HELI|nr:RNA-binding S4 domain-containing protein [Helicobacter marmotae]RDU59127.1 RNA-binding S4 domain-containing protein [Helicobacter marmotae]